MSRKWLVVVSCLPYNKVLSKIILSSEVKVVVSLLNFVIVSVLSLIKFVSWFSKSWLKKVDINSVFIKILEEEISFSWVNVVPIVLYGFIKVLSSFKIVIIVVGIVFSHSSIS